MRKEIYGLVLHLSSAVVFVVYLGWALIPDDVLEAVGVTYYPNKYWSLAIPIFLLGLIPFTLLMYTAINLLRTPGLASFETVTDSFSPLLVIPSMERTSIGKGEATANGRSTSPDGGASGTSADRWKPDGQLHGDALADAPLDLVTRAVFAGV
ncbi:PIG-P, partial [Zopfochytrium polystomum]